MSIILIDSIFAILLIYIIYKLLLVLRGTRAVLILRGISLLLALFLVWYALRSFFQFQTEFSKLVLEQAFLIGSLFFAIIFQRELRRALESLGRTGIWRRFSKSNTSLSTLMASEITRGVFYLVRDQLGALIVIERETGLAEYFETGVRIESSLSAEVLQAIFVSKSMLHDGAVIIQNDIIKAANCYLPLSDSPYVDKELGTRHRAGIGISELSDAVAVIVSEETGNISIAIDGNLKQVFTEEELLSTLFKELQRSR
ncbi:MAG: hypothetical protein RLZ12_272 [Bacillota bacterium]|jgi:diadenylate cyclase